MVHVSLSRGSRRAGDTLLFAAHITVQSTSNICVYTLTHGRILVSLLKETQRSSHITENKVKHPPTNKASLLLVSVRGYVDLKVLSS